MNKIFYSLLFFAFLLACQHDEVNTYSIKGFIGYHNYVFPDEIENSTVKLLEGDQLIATSGIVNGNFLFENVREGRNYTVLPESLDGDRTGVSALDLVMVEHYINGTGTLSAFQKISADMNKDNVIDQTDLDLIRNCILGNQCSTWRFVTEDYDGNGNGKVDQYPITNLMSDQEVNFIPVRPGDVSCTTCPQ